MEEFDNNQLTEIERQRRLNKLFKEYGDVILLVALTFTKNSEDAEEIRNDIFLKAVKKNYFDDPKIYNIRGYLSRLAWNASIKLREKQLKKEAKQEKYSNDPSSKDMDTVKMYAMDIQNDARLMEMLPLNEYQKLLFEFRFVKRKSISEIARNLGMDRSTITNHLLDIRRKLKDWHSRMFSFLSYEAEQYLELFSSFVF